MPRTRRFSGRPNTVAGLLLELVRGVVQRSSARRVNAKAAPPPRERRRLSTRTRHRTAAVALLLALSGIGLARRLWAPSEATAPATRPEAAEEDRRAGVPPLRLQPNGAHLFRTSNGYLAFFQSRPDVYSLVDLDSRGRARAPSRKIQVTDTAAVARIGERFILAFGRDRNRNDDAEPDMDDLSVWTFSPGSGELRETFLLPTQNVLRHAGPRILVNADKTFSVLWGTYGGIVHSLSFDAKGEKVGDRRSSASYGYACSMFETSPFGGGHIGVLAVRKGLSEPDALLLLPGLSGANLPPAKVLLDDVGRRSEQVLLASAEEGSAGLVWQSESGNRLWFGRGERGWLRGRAHPRPCAEHGDVHQDVRGERARVHAPLGREVRRAAIGHLHQDWQDGRAAQAGGGLVARRSQRRVGQGGVGLRVLHAFRRPVLSPLRPADGERGQDPGRPVRVLIRSARGSCSGRSEGALPEKVLCWFWDVDAVIWGEPVGLLRVRRRAVMAALSSSSELKGDDPTRRRCHRDHDIEG
jgi:hypothetical protein